MKPVKIDFISLPMNYSYQKHRYIYKMKIASLFLLIFLFPLLALSQDEIGLSYNQIKNKYAAVGSLPREVNFLKQRIIVKNTIEDYCIVYDFDNNECVRELLLFPKIDQACWIKKIEKEGWVYNSMVGRYSLKKNGERYFGQISMYPSSLRYLMFEMKSGAWIYE
jgi:hypothetical protein